MHKAGFKLRSYLKDKVSQSNMCNFQASLCHILGELDSDKVTAKYMFDWKPNSVIWMGPCHLSWNESTSVKLDTGFAQPKSVVRLHRFSQGLTSARSSIGSWKAFIPLLDASRS